MYLSLSINSTPSSPIETKPFATRVCFVCLRTQKPDLVKLFQKKLGQCNGLIRKEVRRIPSSSKEKKVRGQGENHLQIHHELRNLRERNH